MRMHVDDETVREPDDTLGGARGNCSHLGKYFELLFASALLVRGEVTTWTRGTNPEPEEGWDTPTPRVTPSELLRVKNSWSGPQVEFPWR